ncbi:hypothetical protein MMC22_011059 [Lobaria immixta]|nr:hypothetical protein [Lobaria immixta]
MSNKPHFLARKIQDFQRLKAHGYVCPICEDGFQQERNLWEHAKGVHVEALSFAESGDEGEARKKFEKSASDRARKTPRRVNRDSEPIKSKTSSNDNDSMRPNVGGEDPRTSPTRPVSAPDSTRDSGKKIDDLENLTLTQTQSPTGGAHDISLETHPGATPSFNPLKRGAVGESDIPELSPDQSPAAEVPSSRRAKALSGGPFTTSKDPDFNREGARLNESNLSGRGLGSFKRLFDPHTDNPSPGYPKPNRRSKVQDPATAPRHTYNQRTHVFRSRKAPSGDTEDFQRKTMINKNVFNEPDSQNIDKLPIQSNKLERNQSATQNEPDSLDPAVDNDSDPEPEILLQPETRPISHEQLLVEVKGIYAGLVMVEAKCIDVDEKQSLAAQERDSSRQSKLSNEQWQALIALHKTLLHEHHDFFLASQHPSASPALSRLAAKYTMPARMWRHGIHAFLEVLRHRLPESLDHMLAFIYIAYSMVALLYETISTFEDTWIECLGDLGRYRMAIEDDDIRDREVWSGVARFWYSKAADKTPKVGRLYHHLAILARPYTLQQLSLYTRSLTCVTPFESARGSIMTLFTPILNGKESAYPRPSSFETIFIKAHGILFAGKSLEDFDTTVARLTSEGVLDNYIGRITAKFKEQGVFAAVANIAALFEYGGAMRQSDSPWSIFRLDFKELRDAEEEAKAAEAKAKSKAAALEENQSRLTSQQQTSFDMNNNSTQSASVNSVRSGLETKTPRELDSSVKLITRASKLAFSILSVCLQRIGDKNVLPLVGVYLVFLWDLAQTKLAIKYVESDIPWVGICSFLNALAKPEALTSRVRSEEFPGSKAIAGRPPPDAANNQLIPDQNLDDRPLPEDFVMRGQWYFPESRFNNIMIDDEERSIELASMAAVRVERILWSGIRIASLNKWMTYDDATKKFSTKRYESCSDDPKDHDSIMSDIYPVQDGPGKDASSSPNTAALPLSSPYRESQSKGSGESKQPTKPWASDSAKTDVTMVDVGAEKPPLINPTAHSFDTQQPRSKGGEKQYASDPLKLEKLRSFDRSENKEPFKA